MVRGSSVVLTPEMLKKIKGRKYNSLRPLLFLVFPCVYKIYFPAGRIQMACPPDAISFASSTVEASTVILLIETLVRTVELASS